MVTETPGVGFAGGDRPLLQRRLGNSGGHFQVITVKMLVNPPKATLMAIVITLSPELEALLHDKAVRQGQNVEIVASELLTNALEWERQDAEQAVQGIQRGLDDFEAGRFRSFDEFADKQRRKHNLLADL